MIPYIEVKPITLAGVLIVHPFGALVVTGCVAGFFAAKRRAFSCGLDTEHIFRAFVWAIVPGFLFSRWLSWFLYFPNIPVQSPFELLEIQASMSSFGGFIGGISGGIFYLRRHRLQVLKYIDCLVFGLVFGWFFGRLGCTLVHDHPGTHTNFFLAVAYPDGPRHDLGFYEWLYTLLLCLVLFLIRKRHLKAGVLTGIVCLCYTPVRFLFDFLRVADRTYMGLTPAQYASVGFFFIGIWLVARQFKKDLS